MFGYKNVALNKPATQSSTSQWSNGATPEQDARSANNGNIASPKVFHTDWENEPWWQVDLGEPHAIRGLRIHNRDASQERLKRFSILTSVDGENWDIAFSKKNNNIFDKMEVKLPSERFARYVRVRIDGVGCLHFRECQIFGVVPDPAAKQVFMFEEAERRKRRADIPDGRRGHLANIRDFIVFVDDEQYSDNIKWYIDQGGYESAESALVKSFVRPGDKVLEIGTAIGVVSMTAASIVGAQNVFTFDANPDIVADAQRNFKRNELDGINSKVGLLKKKSDYRPGDKATFYISNEFWRSRLDARPNEPDIVKTADIPVFCLEDELARSGANVLIIDIEGGEADLLTGADVSGLRLVIMETHYWSAGERAIDAMMGHLIGSGLSMDLVASKDQVVVLRRHPT